MRKLYILILIIQIVSTRLSLADSTTYTFLSTKKIFPVIFLDPFECQLMGGIYTFEGNESIKSDIYSQVNIGISKPVFSWEKSDRNYELALEFASYTQFEIERITSKTSLGGLMNNDFRIGFAASTSILNNYFRMRFFHISSHLGDDFIIRNAIDSPNDRSQNYEQLDFTFLRKNDRFYYYMGSGYIISKYAYRKRFSAQLGGYISSRKTDRKIQKFVATDIRILEEDNFKPSFRGALGIHYYNNKYSNLKFWVEYYNGYLPYSTIDAGKISWLGLGMNISLI